MCVCPHMCVCTRAYPHAHAKNWGWWWKGAETQPPGGRPSAGWASPGELHPAEQNALGHPASLTSPSWFWAAPCLAHCTKAACDPKTKDLNSGSSLEPVCPDPTVGLDPEPSLTSHPQQDLKMLFKMSPILRREPMSHPQMGCLTPCGNRRLGSGFTK